MFVERCHSRGQHLCKFMGTQESVYMRKEFNFLRTDGNFFPNSACSHWLLRVHMTSHNETLSRKNL